MEGKTKRLKSEGLLLFLLVILAILGLSGWFFYYFIRKSHNPQMETLTILVPLVFGFAILVCLFILFRSYYSESKTRLKLLQHQIEAKDKLSVLGELSAEMTHEIRTPLAAIQGFAELLGRDVRERRQSELVQNILKEVKGCNEIMSSFLDVTHAAAGETSQVDMRDVIDTALEVATAKAGSRKIQITRNHPPGVPAASGNFEQLRQVFTNLIMNAIQAMDRGGRLDISTWVEKDMVFAACADNGCGMTEEVRSRLFEPFFTTKEGGIGLGLAIVNRVIKQHGGTIQVESKPGKGSKFTISLPARGK